uniref:Uncharacterized protein n=1 Tax=Oryza meridionalis TaxID=40149 RepID=A0A0E0CPH1_9ORYZ
MDIFLCFSHGIKSGAAPPRIEPAAEVAARLHRGSRRRRWLPAEAEAAAVAVAASASWRAPPRVEAAAAGRAPSVLLPSPTPPKTVPSFGGGWRHRRVAATCLVANRRCAPEDTPPAATARVSEDTRPHRHLRPAGEEMRTPNTFFGLGTNNGEDIEMGGGDSDSEQVGPVDEHVNPCC